MTVILWNAVNYRGKTFDNMGPDVFTRKDRTRLEDARQGNSVTKLKKALLHWNLLETVERSPECPTASARSIRGPESFNLKIKIFKSGKIIFNFTTRVTGSEANLIFGINLQFTFSIL
jgi:hypothetical protein